MTELKHYLQDGADYQARAVLMFLQADCNIQESWNDNRNVYEAQIQVARWENCREQGYIVSLRVNSNQLNIAFFEHRNSVNICAVKWEQLSMNSLGISDAKFGDVYTTKYDVSHSVCHGEAFEMANWIMDEMIAFYKRERKK